MQQSTGYRHALGGILLALGLAWLPLSAQAQSVDDIFEAPDRPSLNFYGSPGLVDMPTAEALPDGQIAVGISSFGGNTRTTLTFQATPRISASFRYVGIRNANLAGFETYRDRSFDFRFLVNRESKYLPAVTVGLQDFAGTGIYAGEYVVATKTFDPASIPGRFKLTGGIGWGRLGSSGSIGSPFGGNRPTFTGGSTGGELSVDQWFRGPAAPFGGVEWLINDRFGLKAEYSSDIYRTETINRDVFDRKSRFNFGAEYQYSESIRVGAYYLYGSELGVNLQFQLNPRKPASPITLLPTAPIEQRPDRQANPSAWGTDWAASQSAPITLRDQLIPLLAKEGLTLESLQVGPTQAELRFSNQRYQAIAVAIGRAARSMASVMPASVETFRLTPMQDGLAQSTVTVRRSDLEALEFAPQAADSLLAVTGIGGASPTLANAVSNPELYNRFSYAIGPYLSPSYFDPDEPVRLDGGVKLNLAYRPSPGWLLAGQLNHRLFGNVDGGRLSNSVLPRVRTNGVLYNRGSDTYISNLYGSRQWKTGTNVYTRLTAGYLERMFGGVSAEVLWKPVSSRLALGVEANYVKQRDFDGAFGFQDYDVATGHASAYYEFGGGYIGQLDVGRYLAGDVGGTVTLTREFRNGWRIGGFFTLTDVSSAEFGEGSFDKGINLTIPVGWFLGQPDKRTINTTIRPIQRDGGARLSVPGRLYEQVRSGHRNAVESQFSRVWE